MITAYVKYYTNDYICKEGKETYYSLEDMFRNWRTRSNNYADKYNNWIPTKQFGYTSRITVSTVGERYDEMFVYQLDNENGTIFSTGKYTDGEKYCAKKLEERFDEENRFIKSNKNKFVEI